MSPLIEDPFLSGNYAPVTDETTIVGLPVTGTLPATLEGRFLRVGPNPAGNPCRPYDWCTADGMVHEVRLHGGRASYRNRWITTPRVAARLGLDPVAGGCAATAPNARVVEVGGRLWCPVPDAPPYELDADLRTVRIGSDADRDAVAAADRCAPDSWRAHLSHPVEVGRSRDTITSVGPLAEGHALVRRTVATTSGRVTTEVIDETPQGLARVRDHLAGPSRRFVYTVRLGRSMPFDECQLFKHDLRTGDREVHVVGVHHHPGEFAFVADPDRCGEEDDGWLVGLVHDDTTAVTSFVVLDAQLFTEPPVATVHLGRRVPHGFHATWLGAR
jgi:carotenoid cleavage dioxygenase-like enzyme